MNHPTPARSLRITLAQINPTIGDLDGNIELMREAARQARQDGAAMVVFPELSLTGYYPGDLLDEPAFQARLAEALQKLLQATREVSQLVWVVGAPVLSPQGVPGKRLRNALLALRNGQVLLEYHKQLLPTYDVFDERRHFEPGPDQARILRLDDGTHVGVLICEDGWNDAADDYATNPFERLADARPDVVVSINASPSNLGKRDQRHRIFTRACARHRLPLVYVNQVGGHDQLVYDGASFAVDRRGHVVFEARRFDSDVRTLSFDTRKGSWSDAQDQPLPPVPPEGLVPMEFYRRQIVLGVKDYARRCGFRSAVVGSSGGIDSALVLALAAEALGPQNVLAVTMPTRFSSSGSVDDSVRLCANLGVQLIEHPIEAVLQQHCTAYEQASGRPLQGLALENIQARIRGTVLMAYSNDGGHLLLTTGNKSEIAVGYCTLYGDTNGGLGPIGDLFKTEVFALARHLNVAAGRECIPTRIIDKAPSAELAPDQRDDDSLPPYAVLDDLLRWLLEAPVLTGTARHRAETAFEMRRADADGPALLQRIQRLIARTEYKRRQAAPLLRLRPRAFGSGRQWPVAAVHY